MPDCPYCERSFADESEIRKHLYEDHESDELGRIDTKRVEQYIDDHDLEESDDATRAQQDTEETVGMTRRPTASRMSGGSYMTCRPCRRRKSGQACRARYRHDRSVVP